MIFLDRTERKKAKIKPSTNSNPIKIKKYVRDVIDCPRITSEFTPILPIKKEKKTNPYINPFDPMVFFHFNKRTKRQIIVSISGFIAWTNIFTFITHTAPFRRFRSDSKA